MFSYSLPGFHSPLRLTFGLHYDRCEQLMKERFSEHALKSTGGDSRDPFSECYFISVHHHYSCSMFPSRHTNTITRPTVSRIFHCSTNLSGAKQGRQTCGIVKSAVLTRQLPTVVIAFKKPEGWQMVS